MDDWREAFVAMSVGLGEPVDSLGESLRDGSALALVSQHRAGDKAARAKTLAHGLAEIALAIQSLEAEVVS